MKTAESDSAYRLVCICKKKKKYVQYRWTISLESKGYQSMTKEAEKYAEEYGQQLQLKQTKHKNHDGKLVSE